MLTNCVIARTLKQCGRQSKIQAGTMLARQGPLLAIQNGVVYSKTDGKHCTCRARTVPAGQGPYLPAVPDNSCIERFVNGMYIYFERI